VNELAPAVNELLLAGPALLLLAFGVGPLIAAVYLAVVLNRRR
jgi:hypothetical protein